jgi:hypothetical protein
MASCLLNLCATLFIAATVFSTFATSASAAGAVGACMDNRAVQQLIARHQIKTWPTIKAIAGIPEQYKEVSAVRVCDQGGAPYYVVNVAGPSGESKQLVLNAVDGSN